MYSKEESREKIKKLAENFGDRVDYIKNSGQYKEAQIEDEFIKPLFKYLNWNISNEGIQNPSNREFIVQPKGRNGKEPDYLLSLDRKPRFYMEAKHSKYWLFKETKYIWQAYQYAYSTQALSQSHKIDFALLTDFEEFRFFDCTFPVKNHTTLNNFVSIDWMYTDYIKKFDQLWEHFERENVRNGSLEKLYLSEKKVKENRIPPDKAFLIDLDDEKDGWRIKLAKEIKKLQPEFSAEFITQSVQLILDRFIFMKVLIDREIEEDLIQKIIDKIQKEKSNAPVGAEDPSALSVFDECKDTFEFLDKTYNGSIFSHRQELDSVKVGNKVLLEVLKDFIPENSRYNFKIIPVEILGTIYEQFLGKVVVTTDKRATIEYKPEVRKAGGIFYTPDYIVNYIVEKTVGEKLKECKKFEDLLEIKICDPACGSGSFLIAAYDALVKWTIDYYKNKKLTKEEQKLIYKSGIDGSIRLSSKIKREILKSCIYGVDIDPQAVEVTRMSLSLKTLEDTDHNQVYDERTLWHTTILPPLEGNIKCGNSLVGTDIYGGKLQLDNNIEKVLKPFDWKTEFSIFKDKQGFDAVIGNPPYIRVQALDYIFTDYSKEKYEVAWRRVDISIMFIELANRIINPKGVNAYITSNQFLTTEYGRQARKFILEKSKIIEMVDFGDLPIFKDALTYVSIFVLGKGKTSSFNYFKAKSLEQKIKEIPVIKINSNSLSEDSFILGDNSKKKLLDKLIKSTPPLSTNAKCWYGIITGVDDVLLFNKTEIESLDIEEEILLPIIRAQDCEKYKSVSGSKVVIYPYEEVNGETVLLDEKKLSKKYPKTYEYLKKNKVALSKRKDSRKAVSENKSYYSLIRFGRLSTFKKPKIVTPGEVKNNKFALDETGAGYSGARVFGITSENEKLNLKCLLGILNSKVVQYYLHSISPLKQGGYYSYSSTFIDAVPIPEQLMNKDYEKTKELLKSVQDILTENKNLSTVKLDSDKTSIQRKIKYLDDKINSLAYEFYNLTPEEIKIVEGKEND